MKTLLISSALLALILAACQTAPPAPAPTPASAQPPSAADPDARTFRGVIVSLRPQTNTMLISQGDSVDTLNMVYVRWDRQSHFWLDGQPADLTQLAQYMPVEVRGHMRDGQFFGEDLRFSSQTAPNVHPSPPVHARE